MRYRGRLFVPDQPSDEGLPIVLVVGDRNVELLAGDQSLGSYPIWNVKAERIAADRFDLEVAGDQLIFEAEDAIAFSYEGLPRIAKSSVPVVSDLVKRWFTGRGESGIASQVEAPDEAPQEATVTRLMPPPIDDTPPVEEPVDPPLLPAAEIAVGQPAIAVRSIREALTKAPDACPGLNSDGELCGSTDLGPRGFCDVHDPDRIAERRLSRERIQDVIADTTAKATDMGGFSDVVARLEKALVEVHEGTLEVERAAAMADLVQAMCAAHDRNDPATQA